MGDNQTYVGLDVAKHHLDACVLPRGERFRVATDEVGLADLRKLLIVLNAMLRDGTPWRSA